MIKESQLPRILWYKVLILWKLIIKRNCWIAFLMLYFVWQKGFGTFPVFHLIIQLFKIATHNHIAKLFTCLFSLYQKDHGRHSSLCLYTSLPWCQPSGRLSLHMRFRQEEKSVVAPLQQIDLPSSFKKVFPPMSHNDVVEKKHLCLITTFFGYLPVCSSHDFCYAANNCNSFHKGSRNTSACKHTYIHLLLS